MPYITQDRREEIDKGETPKNAGELNYRFTTQILAGERALWVPRLTSISERYLETNGLKYQTINDVLGALDGARREYDRRSSYPNDYHLRQCVKTVADRFYDLHAAPYEDKKIKENGDLPY